MGMKAVITNEDDLPCIVYWTGRRGLNVGVVTYCAEERKATDGVLQVPDDVPCCSDCTAAVEAHAYPKVRG